MNDVTTAFQQHLNQRKMNIINMFKNPQDCVDEDNMSKANEDDFDEEEEDKEDIHAGCMSKAEDDEEDSDEVEEEEEDDEDSEDEEDEHTDDTEKAEIISLIGIQQLDVWKARVDNIHSGELSDLEKANETMKLDAEISDFAEKSDVEKSDILYALNNYENKIVFKKKGSEIIEQINNVVLPQLTAELTAAESEANTLLSDCGEAPTHDVPEYWTGDLHIEIPFKVYAYGDETSYDTDKRYCDEGVYNSVNKVCNPATTKEEACSRQSYNEQVRKVANIYTDIRTCEILAKNLNKNESITLSVRQLLSLKFV